MLVAVVGLDSKLKPRDVVALRGKLQAHLHAGD